MKRLTKQEAGGFTRVELAVVIVVVAVLVGIMLVPALQKAKQKAQLVTCKGLFMGIGTAYRLWAFGGQIN